LQAKLVASAPGDMLEQEADRVAGLVMRPTGPAPEHTIKGRGNGASAIYRQAIDDQPGGPMTGDLWDPTASENAAGEREGSPERATPLSSGPGPSGGRPDPSLPDCTAVMGGRQVDHWAAILAGATHTFMNFKLDSSNYWLVEAGPLPGNAAQSGAWAKSGDWDTRGERARTTLRPQICPLVKDCLLDTTTKYHGAGIAYNATSGPNSNSFVEHLTYKCSGLPYIFRGSDVAWDHWKTNTRPF
jgi:hypothetical protein